MPRVVSPKVFLIAETKQSVPGCGDFLEAIGAGEWGEQPRPDISDAEMLTEIAGKQCYMSFSTALNKNLTRTGTRGNAEYIQEQIIKTKHGSVLEHSSVTLAFVDVSRVFTHELVRHRAGCAFSQVSGRYVRTDEIAYFLPSVIRKDPEAASIFHDAFSMMERLVKQLELATNIDAQSFSLKKTLTSAFRRIIGNGQANHIIFTVNHRALRNIIELRTSKGAEEEIRLAFLQVFEIVSKHYPAIYEDAIVCKDGGEDELPEIRFTYQKV